MLRDNDLGARNRVNARAVLGVPLDDKCRRKNRRNTQEGDDSQECAPRTQGIVQSDLVNDGEVVR